jgi:transposase-like protein
MNFNSFQRQLDFTNEIDNDTPVCPHCFYEMEDAWELRLEDGDEQPYTCGCCERKFFIKKTVTIEYTTKKGDL